MIEQTGESVHLLRRITSNFGWSVVSEIGGKGIFFLVTVYLARILEVKNYGLFTFAQTVVTYFWLVGDLGINMYGSREIAKDKKNTECIMGSLLTIRIISGLIVFAVFIVAIIFLVDSPIQKLIFFGCGFYLITRSINTDWILRGIERFQYIAFGNFATFLSMIFLMILIVKDKEDVTKAPFVWSFCYLLGGGILFYILHRKLRISYKPFFHLKTLFSHIRESIHFTISRGFLTLYSYLPVIYLGIFASDYEVGLFSAPFRLIFAIVFVISMLSMALFPIFSDLYFSNKEKFKKLLGSYFLLSVVLGLSIGIIGTLFSKQIILLIYGDQYINSYIIFSILIWFAALTSLRVVYGIVIAASGLQRFYTLASIFGVLFLTFMFFLLKFLFKVSFLVTAALSIVATEIGIILILILIWRFKGGTAK